jgi:hypothetical protein
MAWLVIAGCSAIGDGLVRGDDAVYESAARPIFESRCFPCHGSGRRKGGLDLRQARLVRRGGESGPAIVPGKPDESLLLKKVRAAEMPPGEREKLGPEEIEALRRWIESGAGAAAEEAPLADEHSFVTEEDRGHWAFTAPKRSPPPAVRDRRQARTPVDLFILAALEARGLELSEEAPRQVLIRRLSFDLLGLPPEPDEVDAFAADGAADAFERLADRLLASPRFGERWGRHWLDVAGYADSEGANDADAERPDAWRYRDYVIASFNAGKPYDVFLAEQIAGDELAGFPGRELDARAVELLAATGFLRMGADGTGAGGADAAAARNQTIADSLKIFSSGVLSLSLACAQCHDHRYEPISQRDFYRLRAIFEPAWSAASWRPPGARRISLYSAEDRRRAAEVEAAVEEKRREVDAKAKEFIERVVEGLIAKDVPECERESVRKARQRPSAQLTGEEKQLLARYPHLNVSRGTLYQYDQKAVDELKAMDAEVEKIAAGRPQEDFVSALTEVPGALPKTALLTRGDPDSPREEVGPGVPEVLAAPGESDLAPAAGPNPALSGRRLALSRWLASPENPLTARVFVNRIWAHLFGAGIVETLGDFGTQGARPSHPELLDAVAADFAARGWDVKRLMLRLAASAVYRQSARLQAADSRHARGLAVDPENRLLWRQRVRRLEGEAIRDALLWASGVLSSAMGGPAVPVKEDAQGRIVVGIDKKVGANMPGDEVPIGDAEWRRSIYIQARRSRPLSFTKTFDVPVMETNCTARAVSVNAPQALTLLNGEAARRQADLLARLLERQAGDALRGRIELAFRRLFGRPPDAEEGERAAAFLAEEAKALSERGAAESEHAALVNLCHALMNASECITIE